MFNVFIFEMDKFNEVIDLEGIYIHMHTIMHIEREKERERERDVHKILSLRPCSN